MAVTGDSFCTSAWNSFLLHMKHGLEFAFAKYLAEIFIIIGKLSIVLFNVVFTYIMMKFAFKDFVEGGVTSPLGPLIVVGIITFLAANVFLDLFDESALALMTCVTFDSDLNKGEPKYGPPTFHDALGTIKQRHGTSVSKAVADEYAQNKN